ncbi:FecCD family ABC transporter permease [Acetobacterium bakii]|uniref:Iron ABC transporter permease n=1 Tax=Acetobacterium bakii TaxID=52689 RepID=A0A0L6TYT5_9FIRM|nr:iron ABC transporter permease [Acetobacterium bakii]KNZ40735.1 iron ABC transporter permease [Acetobacterium bakii]
MLKNISLKEKRLNFSALLVLLVVILGALVIVSLCMGRFPISIPEVIQVLAASIFPLPQVGDANVESVVLTLRFPRVVAAILVGGSLALSGAVYQGVFQNPLVSPDLLGVSSGACVGAAIAILIGIGTFGIQIGAFAGGILAVALTTTAPKLIKNSSNMMLVMSGIIVGGLMSSIMGIIKYIADPETELAEITYWQMGSIAKVLPKSILMVAPAMIVAIVIIMVLRWKINVLSLGETEARSLGINVKTTRRIVIICATLLTASSVCISGTIGWVGLVVPHLGRLMVGPNNMKLLPVSFVLGGIFLLIIDTIARTITSAELPLSILTGLIGAPFYFYLLKKERMNLS